MQPKFPVGVASRPPLEPSEMPGWWWALGWAGAAVLLLLLKLQNLREPYFWDGIGCYYPQALCLARDAVSFLGNRPDFVRPPFYDGLMAVLIHWVGDKPLYLHVATVVWVALTLPATYAVARTLGARPRTAVLATALCLVTPLFFAQAPLIQTDLPAAPLVMLAWLMALRGRWVLYALFGALAVLTKESSYYVCLSAAVLVAGRLHATGRWPTLAQLVRWALLIAFPGLMLAGWLGVHRVLTGYFMSPDHTAVIGTIPSTLSGLSHNFIEGGRAILALCALLIIVPLLRRSAATAHAVTQYPRWEVLCTALLWVSLPICFPAGLPRYMAASLPALCVVAALGIEQLAPLKRTAAGALVLGALIGMWHGDSWHNNYPHHLESNLEYEQLLWAHGEAATQLFAVHPRSVLAEFPMIHVLSAAPAAGYLPAPIAVQDLATLRTPQDVCKHDYAITVHSTQNPVFDAALALGYMTLWQHVGANVLTVGRRPLTPPWARLDLSLRIYRVDCQRANKPLQ